MRARAQLVAPRRRVVGDTVRITNRLTRTLKHAFPQVLHGLQEKDTALFCDFLSRWPTRKAAQRARCAPLATFCRAHPVRYADVIAQRLQALTSAIPLTPDAGVIAPHALLVQALVAQLRVPWQALADCDTASAQRAQSSPACPLFQALPGAGPVFASRLLVAFGAQRARSAAAADTPKIGRDRARNRTERQAVLGALAPPGSHIAPAHVRRMGSGVDAACLLGAGVLPAATRPRQGPSGRRTGPGVHMDPPPFSGLVGAHTVRCVRLSPGAAAPWLIADPPSCEGIVKNRKKALTVPLRACVRPGPRVIAASPRCAPHTYWSTSSARRSRDEGSVIPSALAALRLMTSANFVGCSTGRSAGFAPLSTLSTNVAVRRHWSSRLAP